MLHLDDYRNMRCRRNGFGQHLDCDRGVGTQHSTRPRSADGTFSAKVCDCRIRAELRLMVEPRQAGLRRRWCCSWRYRSRPEIFEWSGLVWRIEGDLFLVADKREHGALRILTLNDPAAAGYLHRTVQDLAVAGFDAFDGCLDGIDVEVEVPA